MTEIPAIIIAALLGALQGFTEFLPISSSAHLYAVPYLFLLNDPLLDSLAFAAVLHLGTLAAVLVAMRHEVVRLTGVVLRFIFSLGRTRGEASDERLIVAIILGTIPAAIAGALASDLIDGALRSPIIVAAAVLAGAVLLGVAERFGRRERPLEGIAIFDGIFTGLAQALALIPGISRSGATISAGLLLGFNRASAARFSFLLGDRRWRATRVAEARRSGWDFRWFRTAPSRRHRHLVLRWPSGDLAAVATPLRELDATLRLLPHRLCAAPHRYRTLARRHLTRTVDLGKSVRHRALRDLVTRRPIRTQRELVTALRAQGIPATQATISRDITELGLYKAERGGSSAYALPAEAGVEQTAEARLRSLLADVPLELSTAASILVLRTLPGSAHAIAASLDRLRLPEIVGTVAGDDTLFVALSDATALRSLRSKLTALADRGAAGRSGR